MGVLRRLASLRLTFGVFVFFLLGILFSHLVQLRFSPVVIASCFLLAVNLFATLVTNTGFRRQPALLTFHVALFAVVCLVAAGRLMYLRGHAEVLDGQAFEGRLVHVESGAFHPPRLETIRFVNRGFQVRYAPGLKRLETRNLVSWANEQGREERAVIGDDKPLVLDGYRFYTTWNKGFALVFEWQSKGGEMRIGSVNLPGYPGNALKQAQQWRLPWLPEPVWAMLQFEGDLIPADKEGEFRLPDDYRVVVRYGDQRWELQPGRDTVIDLPGGRLRYEGLTTWMGYLVTWDGTIPWLLVACTVAVLALSLHFWSRFAQHPWNPD
jgi:cytochrome c biogenesis protein